jgi:hypothetical protein
MAVEFHEVRVHNRPLPYNLSLVILRDDATDIDPSPKQHDDGSFSIPIVHQTDEVRHTILGKFMDEWSKLELAISHLLAHVTSTPWDNVTVLMNALGNRGQLDVIRALAPTKIKDDAALAELDDLLDRIKTNNTKRNYIVHGHWILALLPIDAGGKPKLRYHQYRAYPPSNHVEREALNNLACKRIRSKYLFSPSRISSIAREIERLRTDIQGFTSRHFR